MHLEGSAANSISGRLTYQEMYAMEQAHQAYKMGLLQQRAAPCGISFWSCSLKQAVSVQLLLPLQQATHGCVPTGDCQSTCGPTRHLQDIAEHWGLIVCSCTGRDKLPKGRHPGSNPSFLPAESYQRNACIIKAEACSVLKDTAKAIVLTAAPSATNLQAAKRKPLMLGQLWNCLGGSGVCEAVNRPG